MGDDSSLHFLFHHYNFPTCIHHHSTIWFLMHYLPISYVLHIPTLPTFLEYLPPRSHSVTITDWKVDRGIPRSLPFLHFISIHTIYISNLDLYTFVPPHFVLPFSFRWTLLFPIVPFRFVRSVHFLPPPFRLPFDCSTSTTDILYVISLPFYRYSPFYYYIPTTFSHNSGLFLFISFTYIPSICSISHYLVSRNLRFLGLPHSTTPSTSWPLSTCRTFLHLHTYHSTIRAWPVDHSVCSPQWGLPPPLLPIPTPTSPLGHSLGWSYHLPLPIYVTHRPHGTIRHSLYYIVLLPFYLPFCCSFGGLRFLHGLPFEPACLFILGDIHCSTFTTCHSWCTMQYTDWPTPLHYHLPPVDLTILHSTDTFCFDFIRNYSIRYWISIPFILPDTHKFLEFHWMELHLLLSTISVPFYHGATVSTTYYHSSWYRQIPLFILQVYSTTWHILPLQILGFHSTIPFLPWISDFYHLPFLQDLPPLPHYHILYLPPGISFPATIHGKKNFHLSVLFGSHSTYVTYLFDPYVTFPISLGHPDFRDICYYALPLQVPLFVVPFIHLRLLLASYDSPPRYIHHHYRIPPFSGIFISTFILRVGTHYHFYIFPFHYTYLPFIHIGDIHLFHIHSISFCSVTSLCCLSYYLPFHSTMLCCLLLYYLNYHRDSISTFFIVVFYGKIPRRWRAFSPVYDPDIPFIPVSPDWCLFVCIRHCSGILLPVAHSISIPTWPLPYRYHWWFHLPFPFSTTPYRLPPTYHHHHQADDSFLHSEHHLEWYTICSVHIHVLFSTVDTPHIYLPTAYIYLHFSFYHHSPTVIHSARHHSHWLLFTISAVLHDHYYISIDTDCPHLLFRFLISGKLPFLHSLRMIRLFLLHCSHFPLDTLFYLRHVSLPFD